MVEAARTVAVTAARGKWQWCGGGGAKPAHSQVITSVAVHTGLDLAVVQ